MSYAHLTLQERYVIYHLVLYGLSYREIGRRLNRHHTTTRNGGRCYLRDWGVIGDAGYLLTYFKQIP